MLAMSQQLLASIVKTERVDESYYFDTKTTFNLSLEIADSYLRAVAYNIEREKFVLQAEYMHEDLHRGIKEVMKKTDFLQKDFVKVHYLSSSHVQTLMPVELFNPKKAEEYLNFNSNLAPDHLIYANPIRSINAMIIFAVRSTEVALMRGQFQQVRFTHIAEPLIEYAVALSRQDMVPQLYIHAGIGELFIMVFDRGKLLLFNRFECKTKEDFIYFPLFICEQLNLFPSTLKLFLSGMIYKTDEKYNLLKNYFANIDFIGRTGTLNYSYKLEESEFAHFAHLYMAELCE